MTEPPGDVFALIRSIAQPLRAGTRFRALPHLQVWVDGGRLSAPGPFLPEASESETDYRSRMASAGHRRFALRIAEPWAESPEWWAWMRDLTRPIWADRGVPVVPSDTELVYACGMLPPSRRADDQDQFEWSLPGAGEARFAAAGTSAPVPDPADGVWLRLFVGTDGRRAGALAAETISGELTSGSSSGPTPYIPWSERGAEVGRFRQVSDLVGEAVQRPDMERRLIAQWLRRCSASSLEPVPPPRTAQELETDTLLARRSTTLHAVVGSELLVAANGHLFAVAEPALRDLVVRINAADEFTPADLIDPWPEQVVTALLTQLRRMYALEVCA